MSAVRGTTTAKNTTVATITNARTALRNDPYLNLEWCTVKVRFEKSGLPKMAAISGVTMSATNAVIMAVKATPTTTATARSTTLPRRMNFLKSDSMCTSVFSRSPRAADLRAHACPRRDGLRVGQPSPRQCPEPEAGIEPATSSLQVKCSTN